MMHGREWTLKYDERKAAHSWSYGKIAKNTATPKIRNREHSTGITAEQAAMVWASVV